MAKNVTAFMHRKQSFNILFKNLYILHPSPVAFVLSFVLFAFTVVWLRPKWKYHTLNLLLDKIVPLNKKIKIIQQSLAINDVLNVSNMWNAKSLKRDKTNKYWLTNPTRSNVDASIKMYAVSK